MGCHCRDLDCRKASGIDASLLAYQYYLARDLIVRFELCCGPGHWTVICPLKPEGAFAPQRCCHWGRQHLRHPVDLQGLPRLPCQPNKTENAAALQSAHISTTVNITKYLPAFDGHFKDLRNPPPTMAFEMCVITLQI